MLKPVQYLHRATPIRTAELTVSIIPSGLIIITIQQQKEQKTVISIMTDLLMDLTMSSGSKVIKILKLHQQTGRIKLPRLPQKMILLCASGHIKKTVPGIPRLVRVLKSAPILIKSFPVCPAPSARIRLYMPILYTILTG